MRRQTLERVTEGFVETRRMDSRGRMRTRYIYQGSYYCYHFKGLALRQSRWLTVSLALGSLILLLISLYSKNQLNATVYAGGFSFLSLIPMNFAGIGSLLFGCIHKPMRVSQYRECQRSIGLGAACTGVLMGLSVLGGFYWLVCHPGGATAADVQFGLINLIVCVLQFVLAWMHQKKNYCLLADSEQERITA